MELDQRKLKILNAIIQTYQETGEPVGSRTISKFTDLNLSSATIRNEMADLEEMGLIVQPHTSAGRIPTDRGYRYYVDQLIAEKDQQVSEMKDFIIQKVDRLELLLKQMARILANNTNYATMITGPSYSDTKLKFIQLSRMLSDKLLVVVVVDGNLVKNSMVNLKEELSEQDILSLNLLLNSKLNGLSLNEINLGIIRELEEQAGVHGSIARAVIDAVADALNADGADMQIYTSGATNFFKYPELTTSSTASDLIHTFEEKTELEDLVKKAIQDSQGEEHSDGIQVYIGDEMPMETMKDCSVVTAHYELKDGIKGTIGIIGPKRMDYQKVLDTLRNLTAQLDIIFDEPDENGKT
jgi:heat-inducible transcriptional repressor